MESFSAYTVEDVAEFLLEKNIPSSIVSIFSDNLIDGQCFLEMSWAEVRELVQPLGIAKSILRLQKEVIPIETQCLEEQSPSSQTVEISTPVISPATRLVSPNRSVTPTSSIASSNSVSSKFSENFTIPTKWRPSIMNAIDQKRLTPDIRNEIVRDLVTHMYGHMEKPTTSFCKFVAQRLTLKFTFMRDSKGTGFGSWERKLTERVSNVYRKRKPDMDQNDQSTPSKRVRPKKAIACLENRYPALTVNDDISPEVNRSYRAALQKEMRSDLPRRDVFLPLMKKTFTIRRHFVLHEASSVHTILKDYPALKEPTAIEQEMELILSRPGMLHTFTTEWKTKWVPAISTYCRSLKKKDICQVFSTYGSTSLGDEQEEKIAVILLVTLFCSRKQTDPKRRDQSGDVLSNIYERCLMGEDPEVIAAQQPVRSSPRLAEFAADDGALSDFCTFIQEFVFGLPCPGKKTANYLSIATDIQQISNR